MDSKANGEYWGKKPAAIGEKGFLTALPAWLRGALQTALVWRNSIA